MDVFSLVAKISLDSSAFNSGLSMAQSGMQGLSAKAVAVGNLVSSAVQSGARALVGFGQDSISTGANFEQSMAQVAATLGKSMDEINTETATAEVRGKEFTGNLTEYAKFVGQTTEYSASQAADALNYMALAGYDTQKSMQMLPNVLNLASAGQMDMAAASDMVTDAQSALGLSMEQTETMVDQMAKTASTTNTNVEQLGSAFLTVGGTAKTMKGGTQELAQVLGLLADNGIKGAEGGTHLRNMILSLSSPTDSAQEKLDALGITLYDNEGKMREFSDVFQDMNKAMEGMTDEEKTNIIGEVFNKTDLKAVNALLGTTSERWDEVYAAIGDADGAAEQMAMTQMDTLEGSQKYFQAAMESLKINVSEQLTPLLKSFTDFGTDAVQKVSDAVSQGDWSGAFAALLDAGGQFMGKIGEGMASGVSFLSEKVAAIDWSSLASMISENMSGLFSGDTASGFMDTASMGLSIVENIASGIGEAAPTLMDSAAQLIADFGSYVAEQAPGMVDAAFNMIEGLAEGISSSLPTIAASALNVISSFLDGITESIASPDFSTTISDVIVNIVEGIIVNLPKVIEVGGKILLALIQGIFALIGSLIDAASRLIVDLVTAIGNAIKSSGIIDKGKEIINNLIDGIKSMWSDLKQKASETIDKISEAWQNVKDIGKNLVEGLWKGIKEKMEWLKKKVGEFGEAIMGKIKDVFGIKSPSKRFAEIGGYLAQGLGVGWDKESGKVIDKINNSMQFDAHVNGLEGAFGIPGLNVGDVVSQARLYSQSNSAVLARMDAMLTIMAQYFPEIAEKAGSGGVSADYYNRALGTLLV